MAEIDIVPYIGTRTPADFDTLFDELEAARGSSASLSDAIAEKADNATTLSGYGITDAYTKAETDTALAGKQDALSQSQLDAANSGITAEKLTADEAAIAEVVDNGAKNFLTENTKTETGQWTNIPVVLQAGSYVLSIGTLSSTDTDATTCQLCLFNSANQNLLGSYPKLNRGNNIVYSFEISSESAYLRIYSSDTTAHGTGDTVTVTNAMICTAADWKVSQKYVPYAPTNRELYEMIKALQNGTRSAPALAKAEPEETEPETGEEETR